GSGWLAVDPAGGQAFSGATAQLTVTANPANLPPGVYSGEVNVSLAGGAVRGVSVTLIVSSAEAPASKSTRSAGAGAPTRLALTSTSLPGAFSAPASWPQPLLVRVTDDCGAPAANAKVVASFSNGDPPLSLNLSDAQNGIYSGVWVPGAAAAPAS